jgi:hypothetical protein
MYLRVTRRRNRDGSVVEYYQLAETRWDATKRRPTKHIVHNFGRADALDREALRRLARSIARVGNARLDVPAEVAPPGETIDIEPARSAPCTSCARCGKNSASPRFSAASSVAGAAAPPRVGAVHDGRQSTPGAALEARVP